MVFDGFKVVGILVSYQPREDVLPNVLRSISSQVHKLLIIDNSSDDKLMLEELVGHHSNAEIVFLHSNVGLASAQNAGVEAAKKYNATHVVFFDQDSVLNEGFISGLLKAERELLLQGEKLAAVGPAFYDLQTGGSFPATAFLGPFTKRISTQNQFIKASFIISSGCLVRMSVFDEVGLMRDELFIDYIDVEWCFRAQSLGYLVFICPKTKMAHSIGDSRLSFFGRTISVHSAMRRYFLIRNCFFIMRKSYIPLGYKCREIVFNILRCIIGVSISKDKVGYLKFIYSAIIDGVLGRFGPFVKSNKL